MKSIGILVAAIVIIGTTVGGYALWQYQSEPQQLKRACVAATWNKLVAPSTAKLVSFAFVPAAKETILTAKLQADVDAAQKTVNDLKAAEERAHALLKESSDQSIKASKEGNVSAGEAAFNTSLASFQNSTDAMIAGIKAKTNLNAAKGELASFREAALNEIVLSFDAQNRASAMIRMQSVCTYKPASNLKSELATVVVANLGERGE